MAPDISIVLTVYNKARYLPNTIASLKGQNCPQAIEFIFVDDASTDDSIPVIERETSGMNNVTIIKNEENKGPAIRLNQGAKLASGQYLFLMDSDDIAPQNTINLMMATMHRFDADVVYGRSKKTQEKAEDLIRVVLPEAANSPLVSDTPLEVIIDKRVVQLTALVSREVFEKAGGCDERIFIQDESLVMRLGLSSSRFVYLQEATRYVLQDDGDTQGGSEVQGESGLFHLSADKTQQHVDKFLALYWLFKENQDKLGSKLKTSICGRLNSAYWKYYRKQPWSARKLGTLLQYVLSQLGRKNISSARLERMRADIESCKSYRKPAAF